VYVAGGQQAKPADLAILFSNGWLAKFLPSGEKQWEVTWQPTELYESTATSLAVLPDATGAESLVALSSIYGEADRARLRRFATDGSARDDVKLEPELTRVRAATGTSLLTTGSELIEERAGRPFTQLLVAGVENTTIDWRQNVVGSDGSISAAYDAVAADENFYYLAGSRGNASDSNASDALIAAGSPSEGIAWQAVPVAGGGNGRAVSVDALDDGVLVAGTGEHSFVSKFDRSGAEVWARELDRYPSVVRVAPHGYLVGYQGSESGSTPLDPLRLDYFSSTGSLRWRLTDSSCNRVADMTVAGTVLYVLESCGFKFRLERYELN
jgi:hypothetical protein